MRGERTETDGLFAAVRDLDVLHVPHIRQARSGDPLEYERVKNAYQVEVSILEKARLGATEPAPIASAGSRARRWRLPRSSRCR